MTTGGVANQNFRLNSLNDPDYTGGGHQPRFFDQLAALYQYYTVVGVTFKVTFVPYSSSVPIFCLTYNDGNFSTSPVSMGGATGAINSELDRTTTDVVIPGAPAKSRVVKVSLPFLAGSKETVTEWASNSNNWVPVASNPAQVAFLLVQTEPTDAASSAACTLIVDITYDTVFNGLVAPASS
jgi:hypothetical protein